MKKQVFFAPALAMFLALGACSNEDNLPQTVDLNTPIDLSFGLGAETKVAIENPTAFDTDDAVGVYLATSDDNTQAAINAGEVNTGQFTKTSDGWSGAIYWQNTAQYHTLYGYYPYDAALTGTQTSKSVTVAADQHTGNGAAYKAADYLWGVNNPVKATTSSQTMQLKHQMARVVINLSAGTDMTDQEIDEMAANLKMLASSGKNIPTEGTFEVTTGTITANAGNVSTLTEVTPYRTGGSRQYTYYAILLPGTEFTQGEAFVRLTDTDGTPYLYNLSTGSDLQLLAGKEYIFTLKANKAGISLDQFTIKGWEQGSSTSGDLDIDIQ